MTRRILVTTGNGMFGHHLIEQLRGRDDIQVRAMVRDTARFDLAGPNIEVVTGDLDDPASLIAPTQDVTSVFLTAPMDDRIRQRETAVVDAARANGTPLILKLAGAVQHHGDALSQQHTASIAHLEQSGLPWTLISPNSVMETSLNSLAEQLPMGLFFGMSGHGRIGMVAADDVARVTAAVATTDGHESQNYVCTGPEAFDLPHLATVLSDVLGRKITYLDLPEDDFARLMLDHGGFSDPDALETQVLCHLRAWKAGGADVVTDTVARLTGTPPTSVRAWIEARRSEFSRSPKLSDRLAGALLQGKYRKDRLPDS